MRGERDRSGPAGSGGRRGLAIRGGAGAGATYRKREDEDEDEEAVHGAAAVGADAGRRVGDPSHNQNGPSPASPTPAVPSRGATPPALPRRAEPERFRWKRRASARESDTRLGYLVGWVRSLGWLVVRVG